MRSTGMNPVHVLARLFFILHAVIFVGNVRMYCRYIATVAMLPSIVSEKHSPLLQTALEVAAFVMGVGMMVLVALYE